MRPLSHSQFLKQVRPDLTRDLENKMQAIPNKLFHRKEYQKKCAFWENVLSEYTWQRRTLSLSESEIADCFHFTNSDCKKLIQYLLEKQVIEKARRSGRYIFKRTVNRLNAETKEQLLAFNDEYLSIGELQTIDVLWSFIENKKHNQDILKNDPSFCIELKFNGDMLRGGKIRQEVKVLL